MPVNNDQIYAGPADVLISGTVGGIAYNMYNIGASTPDGVTINLTQRFLEVGTDRTGEDPARIFLSGEGATITTPLSQEAFDQFFIGYPGAVSGTGNVITAGRDVGYDVAANWSVKLFVRPVDTARPEFEFFKVVPTGEKSLSYNTQGATVLNVEWRALKDSDRSQGQQLFKRRPQS